jgi:CIC family chloride channel protein
VILGMASFFAAAANTPVSTLIMVSEMTGSYALLLPAMWVCALAYLMGRRWAIFSEQLPSRVDSPAHRGDFTVDVLQGMTIRDAVGRATRQFRTVALGEPLSQIVQMIADTRQTCFPVVDAQGRYYGLFGLNDVRQFLYESGDVGDLAVAQDLADAGAKPLTLQMDLSSAISQFALGRYEELPVVDEDQPGEVIALLRRQDVIAVYSARLLAMRKDGVGTTA